VTHPRLAASLRDAVPLPTARALAVVGGALIFLGILVMRRSDAAAPPPALPIGILADVFPNPVWVLIGTLCAVLGCIVAFVWLPEYTWVDRDAPQPREATPRGSRLPVRLAAGLAAAGLYAYVLAQAPGHNAGAAVLVCLVGSIALCGLAIKGAARGGRGAVRSGGLRLTWRDGAVIIAVMAAFVALNAHDLRNWVYAYYGDEWAFYDFAKGIALGQGGDFLSQSGVYQIHPIANSAYQALVMRLFGLNVFGWRMSAILSVVLPIAALYWLAKGIGGSVCAAVASILYATCHLLWAFAHIGYNNNDLLLPMIPAAALLYAGLRRGSVALLFAAGACAGAGWYTIFTGRLMIGVVALVTLTYWPGGWRPALRNIAAVLAGFALVALPLVLDNGFDTIRQMLPLVSLSHARTTTPLSNLVPQNTVRGVYAFFYATENSHYVVGAVFDVVSAAALCLGVVLAVRGVRDLGPRLLLIWFAVTLLLTTPLYYAPQIADTRLQASIPAAALLAALGLCAVCRAVEKAVSRRERGPIFATCLTITLTAAVALNGYRFYVAMPQQLVVSPIAMTIGAITAAPQSVAVLGGALSDGNLCQALDGFEIDPATVLHVTTERRQQRLTPLCPTTRPLTPRPRALVALSDQAPPTAGACSARLTRLVLAPNHQQALWGYLVDVVSQPASDYVARVSRRVVQLCPSAPLLAQR